MELMMTVGLAGVLIGAAIPHLDTRRESINSAVGSVVGDLRFARARAITSGRHYAFELVDARTYRVQRMRNDGTSWVADSVARQVSLPEHLQLNLDGASVLEFNTRGMMISADVTPTLTLNDTQFGSDHEVLIWRSGQIQHVH
jgi:Tfp pilus assembly protein FimT